MSNNPNPNQNSSATVSQTLHEHRVKANVPTMGHRGWCIPFVKDLIYILSLKGCDGRGANKCDCFSVSLMGVYLSCGFQNVCPTYGVRAWGVL